MNRDYLWDQLAPFKSECKGRAAAVSSAVLECRGEQGGVVREAESVKYLVEAQSPSLATDPCLLSEGQSWASQLPFSPPPLKKSRVRGWRVDPPIPCNLALCHSCKLGLDICNSLPPFFYTSLFHLFSSDLFSSSKPHLDGRASSQLTCVLLYITHIYVKAACLLCVHIDINMQRTWRV